MTSASIGVAMSNEESTPESLLRDADAAVYRAKSSGRARWHFFDDECTREPCSASRSRTTCAAR